MKRANEETNDSGTSVLEEVTTVCHCRPQPTPAESEKESQYFTDRKMASQWGLECLKFTPQTSTRDKDSISELIGPYALV